MVGGSPGLVTVAPLRGETVLEVMLHNACRSSWESRRPGWVDSGWWELPVRAEIAELLALPAGEQLLAAVAGLRTPRCPADHRGEGMPDLPVPGSSPGFPCGCQLVVAAAWQAVAAWTAVQAAVALVDAVGPEAVVIPDRAVRPGIVDPAGEEVAVMLRLAPRSAAAMINAARDLVRVPAAAGLAASGMLPLRAVQRICAEAAMLSPGDAADVLAQWVDKVTGRAAGRRPMTGPAAVRSARRLILAAPSHVAARKRARERRRVELWPEQDGTATLAAVLPEEVALRIHRRLTAMARGLDGEDDTRPLDAKRADLLADLLLGTDVSKPTGVEVNVTVPLTALLGLTDEHAEIPGLGPVAAEVARALAADASWRAWLTRADGTVVATSSDTYRPSAALARLIRARDPHCRMPGCSRPAEQCDLDHAVPWPDGPTSAENLGPLCRRHHSLKTHYGWRLDAERGVWRSPSGVEVPVAA